MPDQLFLSLWLRGFQPDNALRHFEEMLRAFPFSHLRPGIAALKVYALEYVEPPVLEHAFSGASDVDTVIAMCREFDSPDCAYTVEGWWELLQYGNGWHLTPSPVSLTCFGPQFENDDRDHLRIDLGPEMHYLPQPRLPESARAVQSNLKSVLRLVGDLEESLLISRKNLWSESDENFAARLESELDGDL
jgi:hypothetical protein